MAAGFRNVGQKARFVAFLDNDDKKNYIRLSKKPDPTLLMMDSYRRGVTKTTSRNREIRVSQQLVAASLVTLH